MTDYQKQLVTDNHNLIYRFLQKEKLNMEDWYDLAAIGMCKAAKTFNRKNVQIFYICIQMYV